MYIDSSLYSIRCLLFYMVYDIANQMGLYVVAHGNMVNCAK